MRRRGKDMSTAGAFLVLLPALAGALGSGISSEPVPIAPPALTCAIYALAHEFALAIQPNMSDAQSSAVWDALRFALARQWVARPCSVTRLRRALDSGTKVRGRGLRRRRWEAVQPETAPAPETFGRAETPLPALPVDQHRAVLALRALALEGSAGEHGAPVAVGLTPALARWVDHRLAPNAELWRGGCSGGGGTFVGIV